MKSSVRVGIAVALGASLLYILQLIFGVRGGGDDRPPIVVSDGSVSIEAQFDDNDDSRGKFSEVGASGKMKYVHEHAKGKPPKKFSVIVTGSSSCTASPYKNVKVAEFVYGASATQAFSVSVQGDYLQVDFKEAVTPTSDYLLHISSGNLMSVKLDSTFCQLDGTVKKVEIRQRQ